MIQMEIVPQLFSIILSRAKTVTHIITFLHIYSYAKRVLCCLHFAIHAEGDNCRNNEIKLRNILVRVTDIREHCQSLINLL